MELKDYGSYLANSTPKCESDTSKAKQGAQNVTITMCSNLVEAKVN